MEQFSIQKIVIALFLPAGADSLFTILASVPETLSTEKAYKP